MWFTALIGLVVLLASQRYGFQPRVSSRDADIFNLKGTWRSVTGTITVPTPTGSGSASAWVGIDGDTCETAIVQTGLDFTISGGEVSYDGKFSQLLGHCL